MEKIMDKMKNNHPISCKFYGSSIIGDRGQIVIPSEARKDFGLVAGEKVIVIGKLGAMVILPEKETEKVFDRISQRIIAHIKTVKEKIKNKRGSSDD